MATPIIAPVTHTRTRDCIFAEGRKLLEQRKAWRRLRENARNNGLPFKPKKTTGMTFEQKVAHFSAAQANGCVLWTGGGTGAPVLRFAGKAHSVRVLLWEKREGKPLPRGWVVTAICGERCINEQCLKALPRGEHLHSAENQGKSNLIRRLRYGQDREQYLRTALDHVKAIRGQLIRRFGPRLDVENALQEALLRVYVAWTKGKRVDDVPGFFAQIALNCAVDSLRWGSRIDYRDPQDVLLTGFAAPAEADPAVIYERHLIEYRARKRLNAHLRRIPARAREALRLQWQADLSQKEIAARMQISEHTVEQHLTKARRLAAARKSTGWRHAL